MVFWRPSAANYHALDVNAPPTTGNCIMRCNYCLRQATKMGK
jgi:sulfatase maturation enzyme AslB (radical SAM superfamily)